MQTKSLFAVVIVFILLGSIFCPLIQGANSPIESTLFSDNFESYTVDTFPSNGGWELVWDGRGNQYQVNSIQYSKSQTKSLQLWGGPNWSAVAQKHFTSTSNQIGYEVSILISQIGSGGPGRVDYFGFFNKEVYVWGRHYATIQFNHDTGNIITDTGSVIGSWVPGVWYTVKIILDKTTKTYSVWVNGDLKGTTFPVSNKDIENINAFQLQSDHPGVKDYFDNVRVFEVVSGNTPNPTTPSLVGYWKFDEGSGSIAYDSSGNGNDGTIYTASWTKGKVGSALDFNGVDSWVKVLSNPSLSGLSQLTIEAWIKEDVITSDVKGIVSKSSGNAHPTYQAEFFLGLYGKDLAFHTSNYNYLAHDIVSNAINEAGKWYHVAATWSGDSYILYVDGVPKKSGSCSVNPMYNSGLDVQIGRHGTFSWTYFNGVIDELKIYNYARSASEIENDYTTVTPSFDPTRDTFNFTNQGAGNFQYQLSCLKENPLTFLEVANIIYTDPVYNLLDIAVPGSRTMIIPWVYYYLTDNDMLFGTLSGGHCYGISKLVVDWYNNPSTMPNYPATVQSLNMSPELHKMIDYAQQRQILDFYTFSRLILMDTDTISWSNLKEYQSLKSAVQAGSPTIMIINDKNNAFFVNDAVHAVVVYKIQSVGTIDTLYIADPNKNGIETIEVDTSKSNLGLNCRIAAAGVTDQTVFNEFTDYILSSLMLWVQCPVQMEISNAAGQSIGWSADGSKLQNFHAMLYQVDDSQLIIIPESSGNYKVKIVGTGNGNYSLTTFRASERQIIAESKVSSIASEQRIEYTVNVNNGTLENTISSIPWMYIVVFIIVVIIIVTTSITYFLRRKKRRMREQFDLPPPPPP